MNEKETLLIVDDTPDNVKVLRTFLSHVGFNVLIAEDGDEGIQVVEYAKPDLILLDIMMPNMSGFEVCQQLKSRPQTKDIPIIFMTALTEVVDKIKGFELGAADYITKPFHQQEVLARVKTHITLRKQQQQLQKSNLELDAFAHTVAHDLKNPLGAIVNLCGLFLEKYSINTSLDGKGIKNIQFIEKAGQRGIDTIKALLMLSGVSRQPNLVIESLNMTKIVERVITERIASLKNEYHAEIVLPNTWPVAKGYAPWIEEIWFNYLSNALKYGGQPPHLILGADPQDDDEMLRFWVKDNGKGLSPNNIAQLFTPFTRLHQKRVEGHGLGLSIVQQIVEKLGGKVGVDSEIGEGSLFYFTLPASNRKMEIGN